MRLKCGDPFVFGRGGEEALALARAGVPFEIVPGVSTAVAAPALAGIPVTHRGMASSFLVVTGHHEATYAPILDGLPPGSATLVMMMGLGQRARIAERLAARGWPGRDTGGGRRRRVHAPELALARHARRARAPSRSRSPRAARRGCWSSARSSASGPSSPRDCRRIFASTNVEEPKENLLERESSR